jgi:hypothetical protein
MSGVLYSYTACDILFSWQIQAATHISAHVNTLAKKKIIISTPFLQTTNAIVSLKIAFHTQESAFLKLMNS